MIQRERYRYMHDFLHTSVTYRGVYVKMSIPVSVKMTFWTESSGVINQFFGEDFREIVLNLLYLREQRLEEESGPRATSPPLARRIGWYLHL